MCGITGFFGSGADGGDDTLRRMTARLAHRGPDASGHWSDPDAGVWLGHRRLAIVDLSDAGCQPMRSPSGRYVTVLNGEIYNYRALRKELLGRGVSLRSESDTEVALAAFDVWGVHRAVEQLVGMFAFAVWDKEQRALHLIRDRLGEKPLYVATLDGGIAFASELKSLRLHPRWKGEIDRTVLGRYLELGFVPGDSCIFENVRKVTPGSVLTFTSASAEPTTNRYWRPEAAVAAGRAAPFDDESSAIIATLDARLRETVRDEMVADVELGAFLSGGVDSSLIVALMQAQSSIPVRTFTIGFHDKEFDESVYARDVARHLGTNHTEFIVDGAEALAVVPKLPELYDEPFADHSQIPTHLVSALARRHVKVSLSGDGGDELFGGYTRYLEVDRLGRRIGPLPRAARVRLGQAIGAISTERWDSFARSPIGRLAPFRRVNPSGSRMRRLSHVLRAATNDELYDAVMRHWQPDEVVVGYEDAHDHGARAADDMPLMDRMMLRDLSGYLTDDILVKVDRAAMAVGLETRAPFLDHRVVELAWRIPMSMKVRGGQGKWVLRELLDRYVPRTLIERPKMGFGVPLARWLRGPLFEWASELLDADRLKRQGFLRPEPIHARWRAHQSGRSEHQNQLWDILIFQAWLAEQ